MASIRFPSDRRLPNWLSWYLNFGLAGKNKRQKRKLLALNIISLVGGLNVVSYVIGYLMYDISLAPVAIVASIMGVFYATLPFVFHLVPRSLMLAYVTVGACALTFWNTRLVGADSGIFLYLLVIPGAILVVLGPAWRMHIAFAVLFCSTTILAIVFLNDVPTLPASRNSLFQGTLMTLSVFGTAVLSISVAYVGFFQAEQAEDALEVEYARSESLLYNLLPEDIAARLKVEPDKTIADSLPQVAILFADIVDFTPRAASLPPEEVVGFLNRIFSRFDKLAEKHGLEKIKTIGDAYMVAAGMPSPVGDPVHRIAEMALDMQRATKAMSPDFPEGLQVRIGLHAGPAVAGVIGNKKLFYDVWGETVNTASRMESHGEPGRIQVTGPAFEELKNDYEFQERGIVDIKGMGSIETWWLKGRAASA